MQVAEALESITWQGGIKGDLKQALVSLDLVLLMLVLYCIVYKFLKWPKYKPQGPLGIDIISSRLLSRKR